MTIYLNPPLTARNGHTLKGIFAGRVSDPGPGKQSILSLDDQESMHSEWLKANTELPFQVTVVGGAEAEKFSTAKSLTSFSIWLPPMNMTSCERKIWDGSYVELITDDISILYVCVRKGVNC